MVSSFHTLEDAQYALQIFNENRSEEFNTLEKELNFQVIARASDNLYVIAIEAFKDYKEAKKHFDIGARRFGLGSGALVRALRRPGYGGRHACCAAAAVCIERRAIGALRSCCHG